MSYRGLWLAFGWAFASFDAGVAAAAEPSIPRACATLETATTAHDVANDGVFGAPLSRAAEALAGLRNRFVAEPTQWALAAGARHADFLLRQRLAQLLCGPGEVVQARAAEASSFDETGAAARAAAQGAAVAGTMR